jgi:hypothetical protein
MPNFFSAVRTASAAAGVKKMGRLAVGAKLHTVSPPKVSLPVSIDSTVIGKRNVSVVVADLASSF